MNSLLNFFDSFLNNKFRNNSLDDLWNLDNFLNNTRNNHNFLNYFLDFHNFRYFDHFFDNLFNRDFDFFDSINMSENFNNLFLDIFDRLRNLDVVVDNFLNFNYFWLSHDDGISDLNNNWDLSLNYLNTRLLDYFLNFYYSFMNNWHFNNPFYLVRDLFVNFDNFSNYFFYFLDSVYWNYLFHNNLYRVRSINCVCDGNYLLYDLGNFNNPLFSLNNHNWLFNNSIHDDVSNFNMVFNLFSCNHVDFLYYLLNNFLNFHNLWNSYNLLDDFLYVNWNLDYFLDYFFNWYYLLLVDNNLFYLSFYMVDHLPHHYRLLNFNYFFNNSINSMHFGHFSNHFDNSILDSRYFDCFLNNFFNSYHLLLASINDNWNFDWYWNSLFNLDDFLDFNYFLNNFFNNHDLRNFHDFFNDFLHDFFNFNNFGNNSKHFEDVINIYNVHDFLIDHSNNSLVYF